MPDERKKKATSQEELEIDAIFGASDTSTKSASPQRKDVPTKIKSSNKADPPSKATSSKEPDMSSMFAQFCDWMKYGPNNDYEATFMEENEFEEVDEALPVPGQALPRFGVNVNEAPRAAPSMPLISISDAPASLAAAAPIVNVPVAPPPGFAPIAPVAPPPGFTNLPASPPVVTDSVAPGHPPMPLPDASLPLPASRPPMNWDPEGSTLSWGVQTLDVTEWSNEDRQVIIKKFSPDEKYDHIFEAVPNPPDLLAAIQHPDNIERDFLFKRAETEQFLFSANEDLSCGLRPLLDVIADLKGKGMDTTRLNLATVFQSISSATSKISRARRELGRRFVPLDSAQLVQEQALISVSFWRTVHRCGSSKGLRSQED